MAAGGCVAGGGIAGDGCDVAGGGWLGREEGGCAGGGDVDAEG